MIDKLPAPPRHLSASARTWFRKIVSGWQLDDRHLGNLVAAAEMKDRADGARQIIAKEGAYFTDRFGQPHAHPALAVERASRVAFARLVRECGLDDASGEAPRPPKIAGRYR